MPSRPLVVSRHFSLNQKTLDGCGLPELVDLLVGRGIGWVGLWLDPVWEHGVAATVSLLRDSNVKVSSLCRAVDLTHGSSRAHRSHNLRAIETAAAVEAECLMVVAGGLPGSSRDLDRARAAARAELAVLAEAAHDVGVRLALEPMHPVLAADRGVVSTLRQAAAWVSDLPAEDVGLALDAFHLWWEPGVIEEWAAVADRVLAVQIGDWATPVSVGRDGVVQRAVPGDGRLDLAGFVASARRFGWDGPVEVELFNDDLASGNPADALDLIVARCHGVI